MTKKHFRALAAALAATKPTDVNVLPQWRTDMAAVAAVCKSFNPKFDRDRFFEACLKGEQK